MEAVILCGLQGSGKTTLFRDRFIETHVRGDERLRLDIEYIECRCTSNDLKLMAQTALAVFKGSGV